MYEFMLYLHVTGAALLFLAIGAEVFAGFRLRRAGDIAELRGVAHTAHATGPVHGLASLLLLLPGGYLATQRGFSFTDGWILTAFVITLAMSIIGPAVLAKRMGSLVERLDAAPAGAADADLREALLDPVLWTIMHAAAGAALAIIYLMTNKPSAVSSVVIGAVGIVIGGLASVGATNKARAALSHPAS